MRGKNSNPPPLDPDPIAQTRLTHPMPMELETNLSAASMSHHSTLLQTQASDKAYQHYEPSFTETSNHAFNMNASQARPTFPSPPNLQPRLTHPIPMEVENSSAHPSIPSHFAYTETQTTLYNEEMGENSNPPPLYNEEMVENSNPPPLDCDPNQQPSQTDPMPMELENNISAASPSHPSSAIQTRASDNAYKADQHYESCFADPYLATQITPVDVEMGGNTLPLYRDLNLQPGWTHPPVELETNLSAASSSSPLETQASDEASIDEQLSLAEILNKAININASQTWPETDGYEEVTIHKPSKKRQEKQDGKASKTSSEASSKSKNDQNRHRVEPPKHKNEVIDLTIEEVSCNILFRPSILRNKFVPGSPASTMPFPGFRKKGVIIM
jgi:hypothetical protein